MATLFGFQALLQLVAGLKERKLMQDAIKAYQSAKKELDEESRRKLIDQMKVYIKSTLQAIEVVKGEIARKQQELKALKADLSDLEGGRLSKIKERQDKDEVAKEVSVINITYIINSYPWIVPYFQPIRYYQPYYEPAIVSGPILHQLNNGVTINNNGNNSIGYCSNNVSNTLGALYTTEDVSGTYIVKGQGGMMKAVYLT